MNENFLPKDLLVEKLKGNAYFPRLFFDDKMTLHTYDEYNQGNSLDASAMWILDGTLANTKKILDTSSHISENSYVFVENKNELYFET